MRRSRPKPLFLALLAALLGSCGEPVVGGRGAVFEDPAGGVLRVVVEGAPYEMGYWQGKLLADRIGPFHARWQAATFGKGEAGRTLRRACEVYADQTLRRLPEAARQELDGLAAGSGVAAEVLLLTEVMRDGVLFHGKGPGLPGDLACRGGEGGVNAFLRSASGDARLLAAEGILLERRPEEGVCTLLATWPGSLGGIAGASETGHGVVAVGLPAEVEAQSLGEVPFRLRLRLALEGAKDADDLFDRLAGGTAHRVIAVSERPRGAVLGYVARAATREADLLGVPFLQVVAEVPPGEVEIVASPGDPLKKALGFMFGSSAFAGVRLERTRAGVVLGTPERSREVRLPFRSAPR